MADREWYRDYPYFPKSTPREAKGGIKAQSRQGGFGKSWWARRWISVLESFQLGTRLARGRSYARKGQVVSIDIGVGMVEARVQGSRKTPYKVTMAVKTLSVEDGEKLGISLGSQALFAAKLLANQMPEDIETAFNAVNLALFPEKLDDLTTECSCPDWSNPCKHVAAVYYLLGEEFDRDPFLIFKLRGLDRERLISLIGSRRPEHRDDGMESPDRESGEDTEIDREVISTETTRFWHGGDLSGELRVDVHPPPVTAPLLKRLGSFPFWRSKRRFIEAFEPIYARASQEALKVLEGESQMTERSRPSPKPRS